MAVSKSGEDKCNLLVRSLKQNQTLNGQPSTITRQVGKLGQREGERENVTLNIGYVTSHGLTYTPISEKCVVKGLLFLIPQYRPVLSSTSPHVSSLLQ